jgi:Bacterial capsule synthesis protein PGA_cap
VALISHVSSGGGYYYCSPGGGCGYAVTPVGDFATATFMPGWVTVPLGEMYNPVFFIDTAFAIHGDTYVPLQPVSHAACESPWTSPDSSTPWYRRLARRCTSAADSARTPPAHHPVPRARAIGHPVLGIREPQATTQGPTPLAAPTCGHHAGRMAEALLTLFACGDVMPGRGLDQVLPHPGNPELHEQYASDALAYVRLAERANGAIPRPVSFPWPWGDALPVLDSFRPDVRLINLETSGTRSTDFAPGKAVHYRMSPENLPCVTAARPDVCALANNHVLDFGSNAAPAARSS